MSTVIGRQDPGLVLPPTIIRPNVLDFQSLNPRALARVKMALRAGYNGSSDVSRKLIDFYNSLGGLVDNLLFHIPTDFAITAADNTLPTLFNFGKIWFNFGLTGSPQGTAVVSGRRVLDAQVVSGYLGAESWESALAGLPAWTSIMPVQYNLPTTGANRYAVSLLAGTSSMTAMGVTTGGAPTVSARRVQNGTVVEAVGTTGAITQGQWLIQGADFDAVTGEVRALVNGAQSGSSNTALGAGTTVDTAVTATLARIGNAVSNASGAKIGDWLFFDKKLSSSEHAIVNGALRTLNPVLLA